MSTDGRDKILWVAVFFAAGFCYSYIPRLLQHVVEQSTVNKQPEERPSNQLKQNAAEAIQLDMLEPLVGGPNYNLEASALRMIAAKFFKTFGGPYKYSGRAGLFEDLEAADWTRRNRAINVLKLLLSHPALAESDVKSEFTDVWSFTMIVRALVQVNATRRTEGDNGLLVEKAAGEEWVSGHNATKLDDSLASPIRPLHRPAHEKALLWVLYTLFNDSKRISSLNQMSIRHAIEGGLVTAWLTHYPFPMTDPRFPSRNYDRWSIVELFERDMYFDDDRDMGRVIEAIKSNRVGARQLRKSGLWKRIRWDQKQEVAENTWHSRKIGTEDDYASVSAASSRQVSPVRDDDNDVLMINGDQTAGAGFTGRPGSAPRTREEEAIRRRNRQAVVVLEAGAPLRPENILQRQPTETDLTSLSPLLNGDTTHVAESRPTDETPDVVGLDALLDYVRPASSSINDARNTEDMRGPILDRIDDIEGNRQDVIAPDPIDLDSILDQDSALNNAAALAISDSRQLLSGECFVPEGVKHEVYKLQHAINAYLRRDEPALLNNQPAPDLEQCVIKLNQICTLIVDEEHKDQLGESSRQENSRDA